LEEGTKKAGERVLGWARDFLKSSLPVKAAANRPLDLDFITSFQTGTPTAMNKNYKDQPEIARPSNPDAVGLLRKVIRLISPKRCLRRGPFANRP
jgi:hypothetical protein